MVVEQPTAAQLLDQWRAAERRRDALMQGSIEHDIAAAECDAVAAAYREMFDERREPERRPGQSGNGEAR